MKRKNLISSIVIISIGLIMCGFFYTPPQISYAKSAKTLEKAETYNTATPKPGVYGDTPYPTFTVEPIIVAPPAATSLPFLSATPFPTDTETQPPTLTPTSTATSTITPTIAPTADPGIVGPLRVLTAAVIFLFIVVLILIVIFVFMMYSGRRNI